MRQAVSATDMLLSSGIIATTAGRNPQAAHEWAADGDDICGGRPVVVLVDGRTASAAEIMAGALAGQGRAVVVGSSTLGKGLVQTISTLPDGGELFVSWSRVLAPGGWPYQGLGVLPQICTSLGKDATAEQLASLDKGTLQLRPALAASPCRPRAGPAGRSSRAARSLPGGRGQGPGFDGRQIPAHPPEMPIRPLCCRPRRLEPS